MTRFLLSAAQVPNCSILHFLLAKVIQKSSWLLRPSRWENEGELMVTCTAILGQVAKERGYIPMGNQVLIVQ